MPKGRAKEEVLYADFNVESADYQADVAVHWKIFEHGVEDEGWARNIETTSTTIYYFVPVWYHWIRIYCKYCSVKEVMLSSHFVVCLFISRIMPKNHLANFRKIW